MNAAVPVFKPAPNKQRRRRNAPRVVYVQATTNPPPKPNPRPPKAKPPKQPTPTLSGRGAYFADVGRAAGMAVGGRLGNYAGSQMDNAASYILGRGAYTIRKNSIMSGSSLMPTVSTEKHPDSTDIYHKEFLGDINANGSSAWAIVNTFTWNAGLSRTLPYLSQLGVNFEEVEWIALVLVVESTSGNTTATQGLGSIQVATQYDLADTPFANQVEMLDYEYSTTSAPNISFTHPIECDPRNNQLARFYTRAGLIPGTTTEVDPRYNGYDLGRTSVAIAGIPTATPAGTTLAKMFGVYHVRLFKPKLYSALGYNLGHGEYSITATLSGAGFFQGFSTTLATTADNLGGTLSGSTYSFPQNLSQGVYRVLLSYTPNVAGFNLATCRNLAAFTTLSNCIVWSSNGDTYCTAGPNPNTIASWFTVKIIAGSASILWNPTCLSGSANATINGRVLIDQINPT